jgi:hypothetical protein
MYRTISRIWVKAALAFGVAAGSLCAQAAPYPSAPYSTVGGPSPVRYCRSPIDGSTAPAGAHSYQGINLETTGCLSGSGPSAYPDPGKYKNTDGLYGSSGGGDSEARVEQSVLLATGEVVDLLLYRESGSGSSTGGGIQVWVENSGKQITWAFEQSLINLIQAGTINIGYLTIKASNSYVLYEIPTGVFAGRYSTEGILTSGGSQPNVSHVRFWKEIDYVTVAEPGAVALFGLGLLALGLRRQRR